MVESALKNLRNPGTHRCKWTLSKPPDGSSWEVDGDVELRARRQPGGGVYGKAPVNWVVEPNGSRRASFLQHFEYPTVYGELDGGLDVVLVNAHLTVLGEEPRQGLFSFEGANATFDAWAALVGRGAPTSETLLVDSGMIQVTHLEAFAAKSPLAMSEFPMDPAQLGAEPTWSATFDQASTQQWQDADAKVTMSYHGSMEVGGPYRFGLVFSPIITVDLKQPIPLPRFMTMWAWPVKGIISAATGKNETITYLSCSPAIEHDDRPPRERQFQVFQASVSQEPYASTNDLTDKRVSAIRLSEGESFLLLLRRWQQLQDEQNPILNTYDANALGPDQTPRARFLLLIQALEGLCGHENRLAAQLPSFETKRASILNKCKDALNSSERMFLKTFLAKRPWNLETVLKQMLTSLPVDLEPELANSDLVKTVIADPDAKPDTTLGTLRYVRNNLSHGTKSFDLYQLHDAAGILERAVRGHLLRLLGASETAQTRVLRPLDR